MIRCTKEQREQFGAALAKSFEKLRRREQSHADLSKSTLGEPPADVTEGLAKQRRTLDVMRADCEFMGRVLNELTTDEPRVGSMNAERIEKLASRCGLGNFGRVEVRTLAEGGCLMRICDEVPDSVTGDERTTQYGRWLYVSSHATQSEVVQSIWLAVQLYEMHELRECFTFDGEPIFHPHYNVHSLVWFSRETPRDARPLTPAQEAERVAVVTS
jgi:hypothetical protein